ncbi:MAG: hypothetical protein Q7S98_05105, partial [Deltaproteobacteria bacterium]|nr:hypothetical protein [Deltaproteobacteria bacterium]
MPADSALPVAGSSEFISAPRADKDLAVLSERDPSSRGSVEVTRTFLESWPYPVAAGVRYPVLDSETTSRIHAGVAHRLDAEEMTNSTQTSFGRYWRRLIAFQDWLKANGPQGSFHALVVGAGFDSTVEGLPPESIAVLEWAALLDQAALDFRLDVVDPSGKIEAYFKSLGQKKEHTFIVHDYPSGSAANLVPRSFAPRIFGRYAEEIIVSEDLHFPPGAEHAWRVTLPRN